MNAKKIRYRDKSGGVTRKSLQAVKNNLNKVGYHYSIIGYRYNGTEYVMVKGEKGTARFAGFCWGYSGEGVRGLAQLLMACNIPRETANWYSRNIRRNWTLKNNTDWEIQFEHTRFPSIYNMANHT